MDVSRSTYLSGEKYDFMRDNQEAVKSIVRPKNVRDSAWGLEEARDHFKKIIRTRKKIAKHGTTKGGFVDFTRMHDGEKLDKDALIQLWRGMDIETRADLNPRRIPDSVDVCFSPTNTLGALPEKLLDKINNYMKKKDDPEFESTLFWKGLFSKS
jgi:hypothetical protein